MDNNIQQFDSPNLENPRRGTWLWVVLGSIMLVLIIAGACWFLRSTGLKGFSSNSFFNTDNWVTTTDKKYGYQYKHPAFDFYIDLQSSNKEQTLKEFAEEEWSYNPVGQTSPLKPTTVNGQEAYRYTITENAKPIENEYSKVTLISESHAPIYRSYIIFANSANDKFVVSFIEGNPVSEAMLQTIVVDPNLVIKKEDPNDWTKKESEYGFEFEYPKNIMSYIQEYDAYKEGTYSENYQIYVSGVRGDMVIEVIEKPFNQNTIGNGHYEEDFITSNKSQSVNVGSKTGYSVVYDSDRCSGRLIDMPLTFASTLRIEFVSCDDDIYPLSEDLSLQEQILSRFMFN
jgi:hypothetical protein